MEDGDNTLPSSPVMIAPGLKHRCSVAMEKHRSHMETLECWARASESFSKRCEVSHFKNVGSGLNNFTNDM